MNEHSKYKSKRQYAGVTQQELSKLINVYQSNISKYETSGTRMTHNDEQKYKTTVQQLYDEHLAQEELDKDKKIEKMYENILDRLIEDMTRLKSFINKK